MGTTANPFFRWFDFDGIHVNNFALDAARINNQNNVNIEVGPDANSQGVNFALSGSSSFGGTISIASRFHYGTATFPASMQYAGNISGSGAINNRIKCNRPICVWRTSNSYGGHQCHKCSFTGWRWHWQYLQ